MQYITNALAPVEPAKAPYPSPNLAGATLFPETISRGPDTSPATGTQASPDLAASPSSPTS